MGLTAKDLLKQIKSAKIVEIPVHDLMPYARNAKIHPEWQVAEIASSIREFGFINPVLVDDEGTIVAGHGRVLAAMKLDLDVVPAIRLSHLTQPQRRAYALLDNKIPEGAQWDTEMIKLELEDLKLEGVDLEIGGLGKWNIPGLNTWGAGGTEGGDGGGEPGTKANGSLADKFIVPPFSVLDARQGYWQDRKRAWLALGIQSEVGRGDNLIQRSPQEMIAHTEGVSYDEARKIVANQKKSKKGLGALPSNEASLKARSFGPEGTLRKGDEPTETTGTSIFDPVLCELAYRWFCPRGGKVLDPFAGGSVRGIVASKLGLDYAGHELRKEQVEANAAQAAKICKDHPPKWIVGDSLNTLAEHDQDAFDFILSCPPYADLEVYSDDPQDLSNMPYDQFMKAYRGIIALAVNRLKKDRFAFWVVGEVREKKGGGFYRNFVSDTIRAFEDAGARHYNEIILVTAVGTLPLRCGRTFSATRKVGRTHQNVFVFCKGDPRKASEALGEIDKADLEAMLSTVQAEPSDE